MSKHGCLKTSLFTLTSFITFSSHAAVVLNEIDYDQPGTDTAEFIELFNSGSSPISLENYWIDMINGNSGSSYRTIDLSGFAINAGEFFVICGDAAQVANCDYSFTTSSSWFQNGSPDGLALFENDVLQDTFSYEGALGIYTEGDYFTANDNNVDILSIGRMIDGVDTNNNALDFQLGCITPGRPNIGGAGDCSDLGVNAVPVPAAAWLFASGLIGLVGMSRRK